MIRSCGFLCTIWSRGSLCMIQSLHLDLYDIYLWATHTTILSIRGVTIPIYLVSSATDSIRQSAVVFKPVLVSTSDPKSEFLCQLSLLLRRTYRPPETPCTPGISPMPSSPHIIRTVIAPVLYLSTWSRSSDIKEPSVLVAAHQLKSSRMFHSNVTAKSLIVTPWVRLMAPLPPLHVCCMSSHLLVAPHISRHLIIFILPVGCFVGLLDQVNMQALHLLHVIVISGAKEHNRQAVVKETMDLGQVEILVHTNIMKYIFVVVETSEGLFKAAEGMHHMWSELGQKQKVEEGTCGSNHAWWHLPARKRDIRDKSKENTAHVFVLFPCNAWENGDAFQEECNVMVQRHHLTPCIDLRRTEYCWMS